MRQAQDKKATAKAPFRAEELRDEEDRLADRPQAPRTANASIAEGRATILATALPMPALVVRARPGRRRHEHMIVTAEVHAG